jgi:hypothetical protein
VDLLLSDQDKLLGKIRSFNENMMKKRSVPTESVSEFLISPVKQPHNVKDHVGENFDVDGDVRTDYMVHNDDNSSKSTDTSVKQKLNQPSRVSKNTLDI